MKIFDKFEDVPGIYVIKCLVNGKYYVGESVSIKKRLRRYKKERYQVIGKALDRYGDENFEVYVEYLPNFKKIDLLNLEEQLIIKFNSLVPSGYNVCKRGLDLTGMKHTEESKKKIGDTHRGKVVSSKTREKLSKIFKGRKISQESIEKIRKKTKKPILQINPANDEIIAEWDSIKDATNFLSNGKNRTGDISKAIKGIRMKTAFGFRWEFKK